MVIFGIFWRTSKTNTAINKLRVANEQMLITQAKLQDYFSKVIYLPSIRPYFFEEQDKRSGNASLIFTIDNDTQKDPEFCGYPIIKIYTEDDQLLLATFPHREIELGIPKIMRKEALLANVTDLKFEFFLAPESQKEEKKATETEETAQKPPMGIWTDTWLKEYDCAPTLIKLHITRGKADSCTLSFFIPTMINTVIYDKGA